MGKRMTKNFEGVVQKVQGSINVTFRARPLSTAENASRQTVVLHEGAEKGTIILDTNPNVNQLDVQSTRRDTGKTYEADEFFDHHCSTREIFDATAKKLIRPLLEGYNGSIFCYGPTGTGKTFTMFGTLEEPGIVSLVAQEIFSQDVPGMDISVAISCMELYGEGIRDLLDTDTSKAKKKKLESSDSELKPALHDQHRNSLLSEESDSKK